MIFMTFTTFIAMKFSIDDNQRIFVHSNGSVSFRHYSDASDFPHVLKLTRHQFFNFNDAIQGMNYFKRLSCFPLGGTVWLQKKKTFVKLIDEHNCSFFHFYRRGWYDYKNDVHHLILSFLRHGSNISHQQSHARDESRPKGRSRKRVSTLRRDLQTLPRSTRNVTHEDEQQRTKSSNLSRRKSSNPWRAVKQRGGKHAARSRKAIEEDQEDGELSSVESDNYEFGSEPSVSLAHFSP